MTNELVAVTGLSHLPAPLLKLIALLAAVRPDDRDDARSYAETMRDDVVEPLRELLEAASTAVDELEAAADAVVAALDAEDESQELLDELRGELDDVKATARDKSADRESRRDARERRGELVDDEIPTAEGELEQLVEDRGEVIEAVSTAGESVQEAFDGLGVVFSPAVAA